MKRKEYTITDIARTLQVSTASVSRALSGAPGVSQKLRERITSFCDEIGYLPASVSRNAHAEKPNIIALILGDVRNPFYANLAFAIQKRLMNSKYMTVVFNSEYNEVKELEFIDIAEQFGFSGLMLITAQSEAISQKLSETRLPKVLVNRILPHYNGDSVLTDNFQAGYEAALHLITLGHERIGFIAGPENSSASAQRFDGFRQAMRNYSLPVRREFIWHSDLKLETGQKLARNFLALSERPSGIVSVNDMTSLGFIAGCKKAGLSIPEDLSLISFDDIPIASLYDIQLTTISQHGEEMGLTAADLMLRRLEHPDREPERVIMKPRLIVRSTTGPCRQQQNMPARFTTQSFGV